MNLIKRIKEKIKEIIKTKPKVYLVLLLMKNHNQFYIESIKEAITNGELVCLKAAREGYEDMLPSAAPI
jgi:hypothetical protein